MAFEYDIGFGLFLSGNRIGGNTAQVRTLKPLSDQGEYAEMVRNLTHTVKAAIQADPGSNVSEAEINATREALIVKVESVKLTSAGGD